MKQIQTYSLVIMIPILMVLFIGCNNDDELVESINNQITEQVDGIDTDTNFPYKHRVPRKLVRKRKLKNVINSVK